MKLPTILIILIFVSACQKAVGPYQEPPFELYTIRAGEQFADPSSQEPADYRELKFIVKFDSSAIYKNIDPDNQRDVNKLYGFSDNDSLHHSYSARFGWGWNNNTLSLYGYNYNDGVRTILLLGNVAIGQEHVCSIIAAPGTYFFTLNGKRFAMPRKSTTPTGRGYKLTPYFGGDEVAPHDIRIWIKEF